MSWETDQTEARLMTQLYTLIEEVHQIALHLSLLETRMDRLEEIFSSPKNIVKWRESGSSNNSSNEYS